MLLRVLFTFLTVDALACLRSDGLIGYKHADERLGWSLKWYSGLSYDFKVTE